LDKIYLLDIYLQKVDCRNIRQIFIWEIENLRTKEWMVREW